jgi:hypothetical protein
LPYKLTTGDNLSARSEPWSPSERKRQAATRSTLYYSPETGINDLQLPSRQNSTFDFSNVKTQPVVVVYNPCTSSFITLNANAQQQALGELVVSHFGPSLLCLVSNFVVAENAYPMPKTPSTENARASALLAFSKSFKKIKRAKTMVSIFAN